MPTLRDSLAKVVKEVNQVLRGWFGYFKHASAGLFWRLHVLVVQRLRAILKRREGWGGVPGPADRRRWPDAYFAGLGLFFLEQARRRMLSPPRG